MASRRRPRRSSGERGVAMVEFALVSVLIVMLVVGMLHFGLILSFKQDVTRAAAEGAREAAVTLPPATAPATQSFDSRYIAGVAATEDAVRSFDEQCGSGGMTCTVTIHDCKQAPVANVTSYYGNTDDDCITVELVYDYESFPLIPQPPLLASALPDRLAAKSVARLNE